MFGRGQNQCGILLEPAAQYVVDPTDRVEMAKFRNMIWCASRSFAKVKGLNVSPRPIIEEANRNAPTFARIFKEMIIVTDKARPLPRAAKGTVIRKQALSLYENEINELCVDLES